MIRVRIVAIPIAIMLDRIWTNLPNRYHPVAWIGNLIAWLSKPSPKLGERVQLVYGGLISFIGILMMGGIGYIWENLILQVNQPLWILINAVLLSFLFSISRLASAGKKIEAALKRQEIEEARHLLGWHLVSRPTKELDDTDIAAATIESIAENASDSFVAPVLYYLIFGIPGVLIYRYANTADAMLGYRTPEKEWLGKIPARLDDLLNLVPSRMTALLNILSAPFTGTSLKGAFSVWLSDRYKTASPNAGHPMSAVAGALGVVLSKPGQYRLGATGRNATANDISKAIHIMYSSIGLFILVQFIYLIFSVFL